MKAPLDPAEAARLYRDKRHSACQIAADHGLTRAGAEEKIRRGGVTGGLTWCPLHRIHEELGPR